MRNESKRQSTKNIIHFSMSKIGKRPTKPNDVNMTTDLRRNLLKLLSLVRNEDVIVITQCERKLTHLYHLQKVLLKINIWYLL